MQWFSGTLHLVFKDGTEDKMYDISFSKAQERVEACKDNLKEAMYYPDGPVSMI